jgi:hypothetical protein
MNSAVVLFLDQVEKVNRVVETGLTVNGMFVQVLPLILPATRITLSNVPPFITDEFLSRELSRHGKIVSPMKKILSGFKSPLMKHVSHRRHIYMILNNREAELNLRFHVKVDDYDYVIFASSSVMKCFGCGVEGHTVRACPGRGEPAPPGPGGAAETPAAPPVACVDPPSCLLAQIQRKMVDFFWDGLHWVPQGVLFLSREEGGQGLIHLASRTATFRIQFLQKFLSGPRDLVWRNVASCILRRVSNLGLDTALFLTDSKFLKLSGLPPFYQGVFKSWALFNHKTCQEAYSLWGQRLTNLGPWALCWAFDCNEWLGYSWSSGGRG